MPPCAEVPAGGTQPFLAWFRHFQPASCSAWSLGCRAFLFLFLCYSAVKAQTGGEETGDVRSSCSALPSLLLPAAPPSSWCAEYLCVWQDTQNFPMLHIRRYILMPPPTHTHTRADALTRSVLHHSFNCSQMLLCWLVVVS